VVAVIWLFVVVVVLVLVALAIYCARSQTGVTSYETMVELHAVQRRFDVAQTKAELRRDAADARRCLRDELDRCERRRA
jgi:uncharacterized membrane protein (DUF106 family)